ncbi:MAG: hypothetical protein QM530_08960 [Phycisphaerales bacterium]|nr:hypothetical protein [Phycisphaerales bacterium]
MKTKPTQVIELQKDINPETENVPKQQEIDWASAGSWSANSSDINTCISKASFILEGKVDAACQSDEAGRIAWIRSGMWAINNDLELDSYYALID